MNKAKLSLSEIVFIAIMATAMGIAWWAYSLLYNILSPFLKTFGLSGLLEGFWQMGGIFFAIIIRKPGSALIGEMVAAGVEGLISQWGISAIISGFCQGLPVEIVFLLCRYKKWNNLTCFIAGAAAALGGYIITYYWYDYSQFSFSFNLTNLACGMLSGGIFGGVFSRLLANKLLTTGVLNQYAIARK